MVTRDITYLVQGTIPAAAIENKVFIAFESNVQVTTQRKLIIILYQSGNISVANDGVSLINIPLLDFVIFTELGKCFYETVLVLAVLLVTFLPPCTKSSHLV